MAPPNHAAAVLSVLVVLFLIVGGAAVFYSWQPEPSPTKCFLFAVKAMTTSGVPDKPSPVIETFLIFYLPLGIIAWAAMLDAWIQRN